MKYASSKPTTFRATNEASLLSQALNTLREIPNLTVKEIVPKPKHLDHGIDLSIELRHRQKKFKFAIEAKSSGEPAVLRRSAAWLKNILAQTKYDYGLIVAPYVSAEGALICRDMGIGFVDLSGNCLLSLDDFYVERTGFANKFRKPRELRSLFSPRSSRVVRCLLSNPNRTWTLKGLSGETGVSIGLIHRIATALEHNLFAEKRPGGFRLEDLARLLETWREEYQRRPHKWGRYVIRTGSVEDCVEKLKAAALQKGVRYALSGPSGAFLVAAYLNPSLVHVYVDIVKKEFLEELNAYPIMSEGNFLIRVVEQENEFIGSREVKGVCIVSDLQLYLDLWAMGGRGQEAADELRRQRLNF
ncbi:MAG: type IV toxin-antitoxin system AbiEi family antitoxin [Candidatus Binatia bacterium]